MLPVKFPMCMPSMILRTLMHSLSSSPVATYESECNKKKLQFPDCTPQDINKRKSEGQSRSDLTIFLRPLFSKRTRFFSKSETRQAKTQTPAYAPTRCCSSSYLVSSEQLAGNILLTSGAKHFSLGGGHRALVFQHANLALFGNTPSAPV